MVAAFFQAAWLWIWGGVLDLISDVERAFDRVKDWLWDLGVEWVNALWEWIALQLGDVGGSLTLPDGTLEAFQQIMTLAAYWIPIGPMAGAFSTYLTIQKGIRIIKWVRGS